MGRQCGLGGLAAVEVSRDIGLDAAFFAWGHPTDTSRRDLMRDYARTTGNVAGMAQELKGGEITATHEFGHFLHLPHRDGGSAAGVVNHAHYEGDDPNHRCLMDYDPNGTFLCGVCAMRVRGWAWMMDRGMQGLGNTLANVAAGVAPDATDRPEYGVAFQNVYNASPLV